MTEAEIVGKHGKMFHLHGFRSSGKKVEELKRLIYLEKLFRADPSLEHIITDNAKHDMLANAYFSAFPKDKRAFNVVRDRYSLRRNLPDLPADLRFP